jgi:hypothetical protein
MLNSVEILDMIQTCIFTPFSTWQFYCQVESWIQIPAALDPSLLLKYTPAANAQLRMHLVPYHLVDEFSVERNADRAQQKACVLIG